jgi:hypothetical protein
MYSWQAERGAWQPKVHLRAVCQEVIPVVASRGIWPRNLANDRIPAPAILHRQFPCFIRHKFLTRDFLGARQIRGGLFSPKLYTNGLSWQTISWYYPFKSAAGHVGSWTARRKVETHEPVLSFGPVPAANAKIRTWRRSGSIQIWICNTAICNSVTGYRYQFLLEQSKCIDSLKFCNNISQIVVCFATRNCANKKNSINTVRKKIFLRIFVSRNFPNQPNYRRCCVSLTCT